MVRSSDGYTYIPHHITIKDCEVNGNIRLNAGDQTICTGCADPGADAIARRQATAPHHIYMKNLHITAVAGSDAVVFSSGVRFSMLSGSSVRGSLGKNTAIYFSPESASNTIVGNYIAVNTENREQIAIDGSAYNYIADNELSALNHGGIFIYRNCGEKGHVRIQMPTHNSIINNRFYYGKFDISENPRYPALWVASRTAWRSDHGGHLENTSWYCRDDSAYTFGSGIDDLDHANNTVATQNQIRKGENKLTAADMIYGPDQHDDGSLPFFNWRNFEVDSLNKVPTEVVGVAQEPPVQESLYVVQGTRLWRTDANRGISVALQPTLWTGSSLMATLGGSLYIIRYGSLYQVNPGTGEERRLTADNWTGATSMAAFAGRLYIIQADTLWYVDDFATGRAHPLGKNGAWFGATSMAAQGRSLYIIQDSTLWKVNPSTGAYTPLGGRDWGGTTLMARVAQNDRLYVIQDGCLWWVDDLSTGHFTRVGPSGAWTGATAMTSMNGRLYVIQDSQLWAVDPSTGGYVPIERPHWDYSGPTVMAALTTDVSVVSGLDPSALDPAPPTKASGLDPSIFVP